MNKKVGWFRFYSRMIDSPQVLELCDSEFRLLVSLWCIASEQDTPGTVPMSNTAIRRRMMPDHDAANLAEMVDHLKTLDLLGGEEGAYIIPRWMDHQYEYDSWKPGARTRQKQKERECKDVASMSQNGRKPGASDSQAVAGQTQIQTTDIDTETDSISTAISVSGGSGGGFAAEGIAEEEKTGIDAFDPVPASPSLKSALATIKRIHDTDPALETQGRQILAERQLTTDIGHPTQYLAAILTTLEADSRRLPAVGNTPQGPAAAPPHPGGTRPKTAYQQRVEEEFAEIDAFCDRLKNGGYNASMPTRRAH